MATHWGCVGAGLISSDFCTAIKENLPSNEHELVAIAARDLTRANNFAEKFGFKRAYGSYDDLANDPDVEIVYIGTNHPNHSELSINMMNAGKHVLCEKPMTMNSEQAKRVFNTAKRNNVFFMEGIWSLFLPAYHQVKSELSQKSVGNVRLIHSEIGFPVHKVYERFQKFELGGGGVDETVCIILKYKNGAMTNISVNITVSGENMALILGDEGRVKIESPMWAPTKIITPSKTYEFPLKEGKYNYPNSAGLYHEAAAVRNYLKSGAKEAIEVPHSLSEMVVAIMDEVRKQIGYLL